MCGVSAVPSSADLARSRPPSAGTPGVPHPTRYVTGQRLHGSLGILSSPKRSPPRGTVRSADGRWDRPGTQRGAGRDRRGSNRSRLRWMCARLYQSSSGIECHLPGDHRPDKFPRGVDLSGHTGRKVSAVLKVTGAGGKTRVRIVVGSILDTLKMDALASSVMLLREMNVPDESRMLTKTLCSRARGRTINVL